MPSRTLPVPELGWSLSARLSLDAHRIRKIRPRRSALFTRLSSFVIVTLTWCQGRLSPVTRRPDDPRCVRRDSATRAACCRHSPSASPRPVYHRLALCPLEGLHQALSYAHSHARTHTNTLSLPLSLFLLPSFPPSPVLYSNPTPHPHKG